LKRFSENRVAISDEKSRLIVDCAALEQLACGPDSRRMLSNIHMQDSPSVMAQDDQHEQHPERRRRDREEIQRDRILEMVLEKRLPRLRRWTAALDHVLGDSRLANLYTELEQLAVNPRCTPERICPAHPTNELNGLWIDRRPASFAALPAPVAPETLAMPAHNGIGLNDGQRCPPSAPDSR
jgi:hypothetical protein